MDFRKMERPHRSGVLAIVVAYTLLYVAVDFTNLGNLGDGTWKDLVLCHLLPMACIDLSTKNVEPQEEHEYQVTRLAYCPSCKVKKREHECREISHVTFREDNDIERNYPILACPDYDSYERWYFKHRGTVVWMVVADSQP
jgi:hypothetical protein